MRFPLAWLPPLPHARCSRIADGRLPGLPLRPAGSGTLIASTPPAKSSALLEPHARPTHESNVHAPREASSLLVPERNAHGRARISDRAGDFPDDTILHHARCPATSPHPRGGRITWPPRCRPSSPAVQAWLAAAWCPIERPTLGRSGSKRRTRTVEDPVMPRSGVTAGAPLAPAIQSSQARLTDCKASGTTNSCWGCLTVSTGHGAVRTTRSATLPMTTWANPPRPCVPTTMRSVLASLA
jgi:hypothetical protein